MTWTAPSPFEPYEGPAFRDTLPGWPTFEDVFVPEPEYGERDITHRNMTRFGSDEDASLPDQLCQSAFAEWARSAWSHVDRSRPYGVEDLLEGVLRCSPDREGSDRVEDVGHLPTWRRFRCGDDNRSIISESFVILGRRGVYVLVRQDAQDRDGTSVEAAFLPLDRSPAVVVDIVEFSTRAQHWYAGLDEARQRVPSFRHLLNGALEKYVVANVDAARTQIIGHDTGRPSVEGDPVSVPELAPEALAVAMAKHSPTFQIAGRDKDEGHYGPWIGKVADGHLVRDLSAWTVRFAFFSKQDTAYANGYVLQAIFDAHPDVEYTPLDADSHPDFHAQFTCELSYMDEVEADVTETRLKALLPDGGASVWAHW